MFETILSWFDRRQALRELRAPAQQDAYVAHFSRQIDLATAELKAGARDKALQICRDLRTTLPDLVLKSGKALNLLVDLGCHDEAEALITEGRRRFPSYQSLYAECPRASPIVAEIRRKPSDDVHRSGINFRE